MYDIQKDLGFQPFQKYSGFRINPCKHAPAIKRKHCQILDFELIGDQAKIFIALYEPNKSSFYRKKTWIKYIAKTGTKWYPNESVVEQLMTRIGQLCGFAMAKSNLRFLNGKLRFLSEYFIGPNQALDHGADIYASYLDNDTSFVEEIENQKLSRSLFTYQFTIAAIQSSYPSASENLIKSFTLMLLFDAIVGNHDRHLYNWGVVTDILEPNSYSFAPIYDSARGLLWNDSELALKTKYSGSKRNENLLKYVSKSSPKIGWDNVDSINHFNLIQNIYENSNDDLKQTMREFVLRVDLERYLVTLESEFLGLMSPLRWELIKNILILRVERIKESVNITNG